MTKYKKQKDGYSCGPVAVYNCLIDDGLKVNFKELKFCLVTKKLGTNVDRFLTIVKILNYKLKRTRHIAKDSRVFVIYKLRNTYHYVYINDNKVYNYSHKHPVETKLTKKILAKITKKWYVCWSIRCGELTLDRRKPRRKRAAL